MALGAVTEGLGGSSVIILPDTDCSLTSAPSLGGPRCCYFHGIYFSLGLSVYLVFPKGPVLLCSVYTFL